jgi:response regulator RpfG family c-di-GMP phosphodiesterase
VRWAEVKFVWLYLFRLNLPEKIIKMEEQLHIKVLYVDDEENNLAAFKASFRRQFTVFTAISAEEGLKILAENDIHILITDQRMPGTLGTELLAQAVQDNPDQIRILLTGFSDIEAITDAVNRGQIYRYLSKPWLDTHLIQTIQDAYVVYNLKKKQKELSQQLLTTNEQLEFMLRQKLLT